MNEPPPDPPVVMPPPAPKNKFFVKILWLLFAFVPAVFGILCVQIKELDGGWIWGGLVLDVICSLTAGFGLMEGIKKQWLQILLGVLLGIALFVLNVFIVFFIGCTEAVVHGGI